jgi:hypothetical protein
MTLDANRSLRDRRPALDERRAGWFLVDAQRTCLQDKFFRHFDFDSTSELVAAVAEMEVGLETIAVGRDCRDHVYSGWVYWFLFLKGYLDYRREHYVRDPNIYLEYLTRYYVPRGHDPGIAHELRSVEAARGRVLRRYRDLDSISAAARDARVPDDIAPVEVRIEDPPPADVLAIFRPSGAFAIAASRVDGWHRLFAARIAGLDALPGRLVRVRRDAGVPTGRGA